MNSLSVLSKVNPNHKPISNAIRTFGVSDRHCQKAEIRQEDIARPLRLEGGSRMIESFLWGQILHVEKKITLLIYCGIEGKYLIQNNIKTQKKQKSH